MEKQVTNQEIIDLIIMHCSERLDKSLYLFQNILDERESLSLVEDSLYYFVAGNVLRLKSDGSDISHAPDLVIDKHESHYLEERDTILKYMLTILNHELAHEQSDAREACIETLKHTTRTFNREFLNIIYLIILFDYDELYSGLCKPLANHVAFIVHNEFVKRAKELQKDSAVTQE